jgi:hypothetical protein
VSFQGRRRPDQILKGREQSALAGIAVLPAGS